MRIKTGRNQEQLRVKALSGRRHHLPEDRFIGLVAGGRRQWNIDRRPQSSSCPAFIRQARSRVERCLVYRKIEYARVLVKHLLRGVPMMYVVVDDHHALEPILIDCIACRHCHVIEQAKAHRGFRYRVVSGWPYQAIGIIDLSLHNGINGRDGSARRLDCRLV